MVVPFWGITLSDPKYKPQKGTAMEPMGRAVGLFSILGGQTVARLRASGFRFRVWGFTHFGPKFGVFGFGALGVYRAQVQSLGFGALWVQGLSLGFGVLGD